VDDARQVRYKYLRTMLSLRSFCRLVVVANLLLASLLFPTLHFHPVDDHAHDSHGAHRHGIVHADFLAALADSHNEHANGQHDDVESDLPVGGISLLALTSHRVEFSDPPFQNQIFPLDHEQLLRIVTISFRRGIIKHHSPPQVPAFHRNGSPRSPPRFI